MSIFLSRLILNPRSKQVSAELKSPYEMHRTLLRAFPQVSGEKKPRDEFNVLFRVEADPTGRSVKALVQSTREPNWLVLEQCKDYFRRDPGIEPYDCRDVGPMYDRLQEGQILSFRLRANPTKRLKPQGGVLNSKPLGKRVELYREEDQIHWLLRKAPQDGGPLGFEIICRDENRNGDEATPYITIKPEAKLKGFLTTGGERHTTTHLAVVYEGMLRVTDKKEFLKTLMKGLGSGKAFGFGLLSIARAPVVG